MTLLEILSLFFSFLKDTPGEVQGLEFDRCTLSINWNDLSGDFMISRYEARFSQVDGMTLIVNTTCPRVEVPINLRDRGVEYSVVVVAFDYADREGDVSNSPFNFTLDRELNYFLISFFPLYS